MKAPFFIWLLPFFFVTHGYVENFRYVNPADCLPLLGIYWAATLVCFLIFRIFLRDNARSALMTFFIMSFYFFFGVFHDFVRRHGIFLSHYIISLPLFAIMAAGLFLWLKKKPPVARITKFLNYLLLIYIVVDGSTLAFHKLSRNNAAKVISSRPNDIFRRCDSCATPDIYLLLFDEYTSTRTLRDVYHYDNSRFDSFLLQNNFHILQDSRSNYFFTPFSMASIFNMDYLENLKDPQRLSADDYIDALDPHRSAAVIHFLEEQGYAIVNNSSFDLPGHPASLDQPFIPVKTQLITHRTLFHYLMRDIGWWFTKRFTDSRVIAENEATMTYRSDSVAIERTLEESKRSAPGPRFVYMHVFMPHFPFLFDSLLHPKNMADVLKTEGRTDLTGYLNYIPYTNVQAQRLITTIKDNTSAVIIFLSDHGYRYLPFSGHNERAFFNNQNAVYYPDGDYHLLPDSISCVNEFRVVFNKLFKQELPLLKDSLIYLRDGPGTEGNKN
ncbi:MAG: hypothetical protein BGO55_01810 [Sphingobacteriales bacterium 50-39]|nr:sulfatase-like hydrolase/transferase [Sphingobacteriales bacterium]OJW55313.1 MAG: hypothetical protein BGO55_01810 [Sphingobacteriales bacterium 50-39]